MAIDWSSIFKKLKGRIDSVGVRVHSLRLGPQTTGIFDGLSIMINSECDLETRSHNLVHSFGHIVQWSLERPRCEALYEALYAAKERKHEDRRELERALGEFREYEEEASGYASWLLTDTG